MPEKYKAVSNIYSIIGKIKNYEIANKADITTRTVSNFLHGRCVTKTTITLIAKALDKDISEIAERV